MSDERMIRIDNLKLLMKQTDSTRADLSRHLSCSDTYISKLLSGRPGTFGEKAARKIEEAFKKERFWLDQIHTDGEYSEESLKEVAPTNRTPWEYPRQTPTFGGVSFIAEPGSDNLLPTIRWEQLKMLELENSHLELRAVSKAPAEGVTGPRSKWVIMSNDDSSMNPTIPPGSRLRVDLISDGNYAKPGNVIICKIPSGEYFVRRFKFVTSAHFIAEPENKSYATLDSLTDSVTVIAIVRQALIEI
jgi:SOS-response transcriptional repressor LexA